MTTISSTPTIVCPSWCVVDKAKHVAELYEQEGHLLHDGRPIRVSGDCELYITSITLGDGSPDLAFGPAPKIMLGENEFTFAEAERYARAIPELVKAART